MKRSTPDKVATRRMKEKGNAALVEIIVLGRVEELIHDNGMQTIGDFEEEKRNALKARTQRLVLDDPSRKRGWGIRQIQAIE